MWEKLVLKYGLPKLIGAGVIVLLLASFGVAYNWQKIKVWYYKGKVERVTEQRDVARAETKVARRDEAQTARAAEITDKTVAAQDTHAQATRQAVAHSTEVIHEVVRQNPPAVLPADDLRVRAEADAAYARAQAADHRLQRTTRR